MRHDHIHWLGHASFRIHDGGSVMYIDPWKLPKNSLPADFIFITHDHYDHFSMADIDHIKKDSTRFVAPKDTASKLKGDVTAVLPGESHTVGSIHVKTIAAYNMGKKFHPKENKWVGYIITLSDGQMVYHSGDTDATPELRNVKTDIALLPCGGTYTMTGKEAGEMANIFNPELLIPMHWGDIVGSKKDAEEVKSVFKGETVIKTPER
jgi:L-ascorbate metabolism protein UlaG (beta-lactamase superfamily)